MNSLAFGIALGVCNGLFASHKGCRFIAWFFAAGVIGLIALALLPNVKEVKNPIEPNELERMCKRGNEIGLIISVLAVILSVLMSQGRHLPGYLYLQ